LKGVAERAGWCDLAEQGNAAAIVAGKRRPVGQDEPPALAAFLLRDLREELRRLAAGQREERQLFVSVNCGDDPRRPPAEPSRA
jgi:hypothetical protein